MKEEYASCIEEFIAKYLAVEVLSNQGRVFIFLLWAVLIAFSLIGAVQMEMNFSMEFFLIPDQPVTEFMMLNNKYYAEGFDFKIYHKLDAVDMSSEETQNKILDLQDKLKRCYQCSENWL